MALPFKSNTESVSRVVHGKYTFDYWAWGDGTPTLVPSVKAINLTPNEEAELIHKHGDGGKALNLDMGARYSGTLTCQQGAIDTLAALYNKTLGATYGWGLSSKPPVDSTGVCVSYVLNSSTLDVLMTRVLWFISIRRLPYGGGEGFQDIEVPIETDADWMLISPDSVTDTYAEVLIETETIGAEPAAMTMAQTALMLESTWADPYLLFLTRNGDPVLTGYTVDPSGKTITPDTLWDTGDVAIWAYAYAVAQPNAEA
jgi:hypothetical protein